MHGLIRPRVELVIDILLVVWLVSISQVFAASWADPDGLWRDYDRLGAALLLAVHLPLLARRMLPELVNALVLAAALAYLTLGYYHSVVTFGIALGIFSLAAYRPPRRSLIHLAACVAVMLWGSRLAEPGLRFSGAAIAVAIGVIAWAFGENTRRLAERGRQLAELNEQLRAERESRTREAVAQEQRRIARELHDILAHHMSVIAIQAGLGRYVFDSDQGTAKNALSTIGATAHEALQEMRRLLTVLRLPSEEGESESEAPFQSAPGLDRLPELVARMGAAGLDAGLTVQGERQPLPPGVDLCVYRIIQESLTNALKHAQPRHAQVGLSWTERELAVRVTNPCPGRDNHTEHRGHGLIGMRERARVYGGELATTRSDGFFVVNLTLPLEQLEAA